MVRSLDNVPRFHPFRHCSLGIEHVCEGHVCIELRSNLDEQNTSISE